MEKKLFSFNLTILILLNLVEKLILPEGVALVAWGSLFSLTCEVEHGFHVKYT